MPEISASNWDDFLACRPDAHLLQTTAWGDLKSKFGWTPLHVIGAENSIAPIGAQVLLRSLPLGFTVAYIPKGPVTDASEDGSLLDSSRWAGFLHELDPLLRRRRAIFLKVEPDEWEPPETTARPDPPAGFSASPQDIQPPRTLLVDLRGDEDDVLARMKQKTRYNIRLALKKGVVVYSTSDLEAFHRLMTVTGERDRFGVHSLAYYRQAYELFYPHGECELLMAAYEGEPIAGLMVFARGCRAWYFYGASSEAHRERMPAYLLQWEAMRWARSRGCTQYDLWGVPDADEATLEAHFTERTGDLWGVYRFKRGFGGRLVRALGPWDRVYNPVLYWFYSRWASRTA
jgi:lipid II:glycine glycyltransferase (peptidoglycan interpeptide bridge formation enzyme)